jgi:hypothetical protein
LAITSPTSGGRSVGIFRLRTTATEFFFIEHGLKQGDYLASLLFNLILEFILRRLRINLKGMMEYKSTQVLDYADDIAIISWILSDETAIYNELPIAAREVDLGINADKTKLLIQIRRADKQIHIITLMGNNRDLKVFVRPASN